MTTAADENPTAEPMPKASRRRWRRRLRLPSFASCCSITLSVCVAYLVWIVIDAQYPVTLFSVRYHVGLEQLNPDPAVVAYGIWDMMWERNRSWDSLGPRLLIFTVLAISAIASSVAMIVQFIRRTTIRRMMLVVLVVCAWLSLWVSYGRLQDWSTIRRVKTALPRFEMAARSLSEHWPTESGELPEIGVFFAYPDKHPNLLLPYGQMGYPLHEDIGYKIERSDAGVIRFELSGATDGQLEFHPGSSRPSSYVTNMSDCEMRLRESILLEDCWYFVRYGESN